MTAPLTDAQLDEIEQFLDVWDAAPVHRTQYRDVISSQKSGDPEGGRKLRATTLRELLAEVRRLRAERDRLHGALSEVLAGGGWESGDNVMRGLKRGLKRTLWITSERFQGWRDVLASVERSGRDDVQPEAAP